MLLAGDTKGGPVNLPGDRELCGHANYFDLKK